MNLNKIGSDIFQKPNFKLPIANKINVPIKNVNSLDEFCKSGVPSTIKPEKTSRIRNFVIKFSQDCRKKLFPQTQTFLEEQNKKFYTELKTQFEVGAFEENKLLLETILQKSPKELGCTNKEYIALVEKIKKNILNKINHNDFFSSNTEKNIFRQIKNQYMNAWDKLDTKQIYLSQDYFRNLDLTKMQKGFSPREIKLKETEQDIPGVIKNTFEKFQNITLNDGSLLEDYSNGEFYDFPIKFALASYNTLAQKGSAYIKEAMPTIFKGINETELFEKLDTLSAFTKFNTQEGMKSFFEINGKKFTLEAINQGMEAATYRITAQDGTSVIFKNYLDKTKHGFDFAPQGLYGGLGILREANRAGVSNVPKLYIANPIVTPINGIAHKKTSYKGGWMIIEDVQNKTAQTKGIDFLSWLNEKGLEAKDISHNVLNGFCIDTGFVMPKQWESFYTHGWRNLDVNSVCMHLVAGKNPSEIIKLLN